MHRTQKLCIVHKKRPVLNNIKSVHNFFWPYAQCIKSGEVVSYMGVGGGLVGFRPPQNPKYPTQTLARLGLGKILTKNVFLGLFERFSDLPQAFFGKLPYPNFWSCPRLSRRMRLRILGGALKKAWGSAGLQLRPF